MSHDLLPCGHPAAASVDRPGWGWCSVCAQQAEAALPAAQPSRLVAEGAHAMPDLDDRCWCCGAVVQYPLIRLICDACAAAPTWATVAPLLARWRLSLVYVASPNQGTGWRVWALHEEEGSAIMPFHVLPQAIQEVAQRCAAAEKGEGGA